MTEEAERNNRDLWQDKAEKAEAKLKVLVGMLEGMKAIDSVTRPETVEQLTEMLDRMLDVVEHSDTDATIEIRCACWYRARLTEMKRQLHVAVNGADEDEREKVAASFAAPLKQLLDAVESMDRANHATLLGVIPGGSTEHVAQTIASVEGVDETPKGELGSSAQPSSG